MCDPSPKAECVPAFTRESERRPFVREAEKCDEKRLGDKIYSSSFAGFFSSADSGDSQRTGKCMYIKARWNKRDFAGSTKPHCDRRGEGPCFGVCALVCDFSRRAECVPAFACKSERGPFVREVENAMRNGWEQRCDGNFLAIFAGTVLSEKPNFLSRIFGRGRPFDFSTR